MKAKSLNNNPPVWERKYEQSLKVCFLNIHSLRDKIDDIRADPILLFSDILVFGETWLEENTKDNDQSIQIESYELNLNSFDRGKGLAVYYKEHLVEAIHNFRDIDLQITKLDLEELSIVCIYRSQNDENLAKLLQDIIPLNGCCLVIGDFNLCSVDNPNNVAFNILRAMDFIPLVSEATHLGGGHIDQAWFRGSSKTKNMELYSPYYTARDHDAIRFSYYDPQTEEGIVG